MTKEVDKELIEVLKKSWNEGLEIQEELVQFAAEKFSGEEYSAYGYIIGCMLSIDRALEALQKMDEIQGKAMRKAVAGYIMMEMAHKKVPESEGP
jgi:hypothetical protein